jgi:FkbM family methyltransferase
MIAKAVHFLAATANRRARYGAWRGLRMAWQLRSDYTLPPGTPYPVTVPGWAGAVMLRAGTTDLAVFEQVVFRGEMGVPISSAPAVVIDAGAHVGLSTLTLAHRFPEARIIALEPDAGNFAMLRRNTAHLDRVVALNRALWSGPARLMLKNPEATPCSYQFTDVGGDADRTVPAAGINDLMREFGLQQIDVLKIDIEGAEIEVFGAADRSWLRHVAMLIIETHDRMRAGCTDAIVAALDESWTRGAHGEYMVLARPSGPSAPAIAHERSALRPA